VAGVGVSSGRCLESGPVEQLACDVCDWLMVCMVGVSGGRCLESGPVEQLACDVCDWLMVCMVGVSGGSGVQHPGAWSGAVSTSVAGAADTLTTGHVDTQDDHLPRMEGCS